jgi:hypothetical protein
MVIRVYVRVVDYPAGIKILTIMIEHVDVLRSNLDDLGSDLCECSLIMIVDR